MKCFSFFNVKEVRHDVFLIMHWNQPTRKLSIMIKSGYSQHYAEYTYVCSYAEYKHVDTFTKFHV